MATRKVGPFTAQELLDFLESQLDPLYFQGFLRAGDGQGLEVYNQQIAQFVRTSEAIDRTTQALFILPWSGQTDLPARGGARATVTVELTRTGDASLPITLDPGVVFIVEETTDIGLTEPLTVQTGRRYTVAEKTTLSVGALGPIDVPLVAEAQGYGYNNPEPGTIRTFDQPGAGLTNGRASVIPGTPVHQLKVAPAADVVIPDHVGRYIRFTSGANIDVVVRAVGYAKPEPAASPPNGGTLLLARTSIVRMDLGTLVGTFQVGERVVFPNGSEATLVDVSGDLFVFEEATGLPTLGTYTGVLSAATVDALTILRDGDLQAETFTAGWRVQDFAADLGLSVTNPLSPEGGRAPVLDDLGAERNIARGPGESDDSYRQRVAALPDVVSPNALRRAGNRVLAEIGGEACLREVGLSLFRGQMLDGDATNPDPSVAYAYDLDWTQYSGIQVGDFINQERVRQVTSDGVTVEANVDIDNNNIYLVTQGAAIAFFNFSPYDSQFRLFDTPIVGLQSGAQLTPSLQIGTGIRAQDRFKLQLDLEEFRAFFLIGVPPLNLGDFGAFYDFGAFSFHDAAPFLSFYDGFPVTAAVIYRAVWQSLLAAKAAGVGFDLYIEEIGCV